MPPGSTVPRTTGPLTKAELDVFFSDKQAKQTGFSRIRVPSGGGGPRHLGPENLSYGAGLAMACIRPADDSNGNPSNTVVCHFCKEAYQHQRNTACGYPLVELIKLHLLGCAKFTVIYRNGMVPEFLESIHGTADKLYPIVVPPTAVSGGDEDCQIVNVLPPNMSGSKSVKSTASPLIHYPQFIAPSSFSASTSAAGVGNTTSLTTIPDHLCRNLHFGSPGVRLFYNPQTKRAVVSAQPPIEEEENGVPSPGQFFELCSDIADLTVTAYHKLMPLKRHAQLPDATGSTTKRGRMSAQQIQKAAPSAAAAASTANLTRAEDIDLDGFLVKYSSAEWKAKKSAPSPTPAQAPPPSPAPSSPPKKKVQLLQPFLKDYLAAVDPSAVASSKYRRKKVADEMADRRRVAPQLAPILERHPPSDSVRSDFAVIQEKVNEGEMITPEQCYTFYALQHLTTGPLGMFGICRLCVRHLMTFRTTAVVSLRNLKLRTHLRSAEHRQLFALYQAQPAPFSALQPFGHLQRAAGGVCEAKGGGSGPVDGQAAAGSGQRRRGGL
ncbi:hypothetical protein TYRP_006425 [Tyrophagus putrescentiae]|nr:hypothetical protein TYRP_006425 [Tyrophagus putrescentiae]